MRSYSMPSALGAFALTLLIGGCGGSAKAPDHTTSTSGSAHPPSYFAVEAAANAVANAVRDHDCEALTRVSVYARLNPARCRRSMMTAPDPTVERVATYGVGGVADLKLHSGGHATAVFVLGTDREWRYVAVIRTAQPIVGTHAVNLESGAAMIGSALRAMAAGRCAEVLNDFPAQKNPSAGSPKNCYGHARPSFQLAVKHGFKGPRAMGGNARLAFYLVLVDGRHPFTFITANQSGAPRILGYSENPPLAVLISGRFSPR